MKKYISVLVTSLLVVTAAGAQAATVAITVNTSSIAGTGNGVIDFVLNPGSGSTQTVDAEVISFLSDGSFSTPITQTNFGSVSGGPITSGPVYLTSGGGDNENQESTYKFGHTISFDVYFYGPAVTSPNGTATSPTTFYLQLFDENTGNPYTSLTSDPAGTVASITVNDDGSLATGAISGVSTVQIIPEPATFWMLAGAMGLLVGARKLSRGIRHNA
jgi:hypothetical protein